MDVSKFLSKVIGIYFVIVSIAMMLNMQYFITCVNGLMTDKPLVFITGFFTLILGLLMVASHNVWQWGWRVIITILCWITLVKGASILMFPQLMDASTQLFTQNLNFAYIAAGIYLLLGILLCYFGFRRK